MSDFGTTSRRRPPVATMQDVASLAGVSAITVSRAFAQPDRVSAVTLARVRTAAEAVGYVPNLAAGSLRTARSRMVAVLVPTVSGFFSRLIEALTHAFEPRGYQLMLAQTGYGRAQEQLLRTVVGRRPDGIVLTGVNHAPAVRELLATSGIPVVETWDVTPEPIDMLVALSHEKISAEVCRYLASRGRRRLAVLSGDDERASRRNAVFVRTAESLGLVPPVVLRSPAPTGHAEGRAALGLLLAREPAVDGVFCSSDPFALGVMTEARVRGIAVPGQLAVVGAGDIDMAASVVPSLTTVWIDVGQMGECVARLILDRVEGREGGSRVVHLAFSLVARDSA